MVTEAQRKARAVWNKANLHTLACTTTKERAKAFKAKCAANGTNVNAVLSKFIDDYMKESQED